MVLGLLVPLFAQAAEQTGFVKSGEMPIAAAKVTLYQAGTGRPSRAKVLGSTTAEENGFFHITYTPPSTENAILYLIADGPRLERENRKSGSIIKFRKKHFHFAPIITFESKSKSRRSPVRLATVLGTAPFPPEVVINERTTVATAYALAQFLTRGRISGKSPGLQNAAATGQNLVDLETGEVGSVLGNSINGESTSTRAEFNSLANLLATCVQNITDCPRLFQLTRTPSGRAPRNTFQSVENIAHYPWQNVQKLFDQSLRSSVYQPALGPSQSPDAWTLAIRYGIFSDPPERKPLLGGPGNIAFDSEGNAWVNNNYVNAPVFDGVCGDDRVYKFHPDGKPFAGSPFGGDKGNGGLYGAGFGIIIDRFEHVWVSNFGFQGSDCRILPETQELLSRSLSQFNSNGEAVSPSRSLMPPVPFGGWRSPQANLSRPQGIESDQHGNIWTVNCGNGTVTKFPNGKLEMAQNFSNIGLDNPFAIAIDRRRNAWVTSNANSSVIKLSRDGVPIGKPITGEHVNNPMGIATDSSGNVWVANAGVPSPPCGSSMNGQDPRIKFANLEVPPEGASVTLLRNHDRLQSFTGGGVFWPWGIAVDGNDNIWVGNFAGPRSGLIGITQLCGAKPWTCPPGHNTGDPISPPTGYTSDGFTRLTGIDIDSSGNVWVTNNWLRDAFEHLENPGGHEVVVLIGVAAPVKTPLIGPPQKP